MKLSIRVYLRIVLIYIYNLYAILTTRLLKQLVVLLTTAMQYWVIIGKRISVLSN